MQINLPFKKSLNLIRKVETVEVVREDLYLVDEGPQTDRLLPHPGHLPLPLPVTEEGPEAAGLAVVGQGDQELLGELETAGELVVHLQHTVFWSCEGWLKLWRW